MLLDITWWIQFSQLAYNFVGIGAFVSIILTLFTYVIYRKQLNIATMSRCIDIYREEFIFMVSGCSQTKLLSYIDFINEELFYFEHRYVTYKAAIEWVSGMIENMPIVFNEKNMNPSQISKDIYILEKLQEYPRVIKAFTVKSQYNFSLMFTPNYTNNKDATFLRAQLVKEILNNINMKEHWYDNGAE